MRPFPTFTTSRLAALLVLGGAATAQSVDHARAGLPERSARIADYTMQARLNPETKTIAGKQTITYRNRTGGSTAELRFHFYLNAFRNLRSTHLRNARQRLKESYRSEREFGSVELTKLRLASGAGGPADLLAGLEWIAPDDGNPDDRTVGRVALPAAFASGTEVVLETEFVSRLPKAYRRTGWGPGDFFIAAQWFPKLGVLERRGEGEARWSCHQFHAWTEFYADFGTYDVTLETPKGWPVGATGKQVGATETLGDYEARRFVQADVHDFTWVTDPDYAVHEYEFTPGAWVEPGVADILESRGWPRSALTLSPVAIRLFLHPEHDTEVQVARHKKAVDVALRFFGGRFGRYPYETLTVVDPCTDVGWRGLGGGMEYPTLFTCGTRYWPHSRSLRPEGVTVHEFGHQFWYGLSANNEFEHSWLDEGLNSYSEGRALDLAYHQPLSSPHVGDPLETTGFGPFVVRGKPPGALGPLGRLNELPVTGAVAGVLARLGVAGGLRDVVENELGFDGALLPELPLLDYLRELPFLTFEKDLPYRNLYNDRRSYLAFPEKDPVVKDAWMYLDRESYRDNSYQRPSTLLATLERMMGPDKWWPCLRRFHERARFAHPTTEDFLRTVGEFGGDEIAAFAREAFYSNKRLDYGIDSVETKTEPERSGLSGDGESTSARGPRTVVTVRRFGELVAPVRVRFEFDKGTTVDHEWAVAGQGLWRRFELPADEIAERGKLVRVWVDPPDPAREVGYGPCGVFVMDADLTNNSWQAYPNKRPARRQSLRLLLWLQTVFGFFGGIG